MRASGIRFEGRRQQATSCFIMRDHHLGLVSTCVMAPAAHMNDTVYNDIVAYGAFDYFIYLLA